MYRICILTRQGVLFHSQKTYSREEAERLTREIKASGGYQNVYLEWADAE